MKDMPTDAMIPGIAKDVEVDFKAALLKARGIKLSYFAHFVN